MGTHLSQVLQRDNVLGQVAQAILVQQQRLEVLQARNTHRQELDQVIAEHQRLQLAERAHRLGHLVDQVAAQREHVQAKEDERSGRKKGEKERGLVREMRKLNRESWRISKRFGKGLKGRKERFRKGFNNILGDERRLRVR